MGFMYVHFTHSQCVGEGLRRRVGEGLRRRVLGERGCGNAAALRASSRSFLRVRSFFPCGVGAPPLLSPSSTIPMALAASAKPPLRGVPGSTLKSSCCSLSISRKDIFFCFGGEERRGGSGLALECLLQRWCPKKRRLADSPSWYRLVASVRSSVLTLEAHQTDHPGEAHQTQCSPLSSSHAAQAFRPF